MNLATARSARRAREVGLRKSMGSNRSQIAKQFFYESSITTFASLVMALVVRSGLAVGDYSEVSIQDGIMATIHQQ